MSNTDSATARCATHEHLTLDRVLIEIARILDEERSGANDDQPQCAAA